MYNKKKISEDKIKEMAKDTILLFGNTLNYILLLDWPCYLSMHISEMNINIHDDKSTTDRHKGTVSCII